MLTVNLESILRGGPGEADLNRAMTKEAASRNYAPYGNG